MPKKLQVTLKRSIAGRNPKHIPTVKGLGLRGKINQKVILADTPLIRGMINKVSYLLDVEEC